MFQRTHSLVLPGTEALDLKQTLWGQRQQIQKLQKELDAERESASTSATEALSVILRLQVEKAALTMEASQYRRMAEEKIFHAEMSAAYFQDLIYQKEMETASLENQVQAYRCRLLSVGVTDFAGVETKFHVNDSIYDQTSGNKMRRLLSLPVLRVSNDSEERRSVLQGDRYITPSLILDSVLMEKKVTEQSLDSRKSLEKRSSPRGDLISFWGQKKKLDKQVKERTEFRDSLMEKYEMLMQNSASDLLLPKQGSSKLEKTKNPGNFSEGDILEDSNSLSNVQDVFEVLRMKDKVKPGFKNEKENLKVESTKSHIERKLSKPPKDGRIKKNRAGAAADNVEYQAELQRLRERIERLEEEKNSTSQQIREENKEEELLKEIKEQLNSVQTELRSLKAPKSSTPRDDFATVSIKESMLCFWL